MFARRSCSTAGPWVRPAPPETTRSAPRDTIFSTSTPEKVATTGIELASGGKLATSSTFPTTRDPTPSANSVSVVAGVSDTIFRGSDGIVTAVPSSSVMVTGNAGGAVGSGVGVGAGVVNGAAVPVPGVQGGTAPPPQPTTRNRKARSVTKRAGKRAAMGFSGVIGGLGRATARHGTSGRGPPQPVGRI